MDISSGIFLGSFAMISWGVSDFFAAKSVRGSDSFRTLLWSQIVALLFMSFIFFMFFSFPQLSYKTIFLILISGVLTVIANLSFFKSLKVGHVSVVMPIASCWAVVTVF